MTKLFTKALAVLLFFGLSLSLSAEHKIGKELTGKIVDKSGKKVDTDLSKKKNIIFYYSSSA